MFRRGALWLKRRTFLIGATITAPLCRKLCKLPACERAASIGTSREAWRFEQFEKVQRLVARGGFSEGHFSSTVLFGMMVALPKVMDLQKTSYPVWSPVKNSEAIDASL